MEKVLWIFVICEKHEIKYTTKLFTYTVLRSNRADDMDTRRFCLNGFSINRFR